MLADLRCPFERKRLLARWKRSAKDVLVPLAVVVAIVGGILLLGGV